MNVAFAAGYSLEGTGIARYQRELIDSYCIYAQSLRPVKSLALVTPFNRCHRHPGLPSSCAFRRSSLPGKVQFQLNRFLPLEQIVPRLPESDLIHSLDPQAILTCRPWLVTVHDVAWRHFGPGYSAVFNRAMERSAERCIATATHLVAVSRCTADELIAGGVDAARISVIYQGVNVQPAAPIGENRVDVNMPDLPERYVLYVGTAHARKNVPMIAHAYAQPGANALPPCVLAGPPPAEPLHQHGIDGKRLYHLGYLPEPVLAKVLQGASALIFPSLHEGFGRPLVEAMAMGIPVLASRIPAFKEVGDDAVLFFDVQDPHKGARQLRDQLLQVVTDDTLAKDLARKGLRRARRFSWSAACEQLRDLYAQLITG